MNKIDKPNFYKNMIISGANNLYNYYPQIDKLNVFPVPDGDTGTNLNLTISNAILELENLSENFSFKDISDSFSYGLVMSARGNSGVIFSQIFRGIANTITKSIKSIDFSILKKMFMGAKQTAYKAVMKPVEGTILTVIKDISNYLAAIETEPSDISIIFKNIVKEGNKSVKKTIDLLPILKEVGVVDSGAYGLMRFIEGMSFYLENNRIIKKDKNMHKNIKDTKEIKNIQSLQRKEFGYCTEAIVYNENASKLNVDNLKNALKEQENNNSIVVVTDKDIIKVHIHTPNPGNVLIYLQQFGSFSKVKIDNMSDQVHKNVLVKDNEKKTYSDQMKILPVVTTKKLKKYFTSNLNIDNVIVSGEEKNTSTQEFIHSIKEIDANKIVVLPNNSNAILAAQNAAKLIDTKQTVYVLPTKSIQEGMMVSKLFDTETTYRKNWAFLKPLINSSISISIYKSENNGKSNGIEVKKNDYVAIHGKKVIAANTNISKVLLKICDQKINKYSETISFIRGIDTSKSDTNLISKYLDENFDVEYDFIDGEQEKFNYLILIE